MTVRVSIDLTRCRGHGMCALLAPASIDLDGWGFAQVRTAEADEPGDARRLRRAAAACPRQAIVVRDVPGESTGITATVRAPWSPWRAR